jgi:hypothetical protein
MKPIILFPCTYLVHIAEEYWMGERFFNWLSRVTGSPMTEDSFLLLNSIFMLVMITATCIALWRQDHRIVLILASIVLINTTLHVFGSIITYSYSPGLISALLLWLPLAGWAFYSERQNTTTRQKLGALAGGVVAHAVVSALALGL